MNANESLDKDMGPIYEMFRDRDNQKRSNIGNKVTHTKYTGRKPSRNHHMKKSLKLRLAALLGAGVLTLGGVSLANVINEVSNKIPEPNEHISNTAVQLDNSQMQEFLSLQEEFSSLSGNSSSAEINEYAKELHDYIENTIKSQILHAYNDKEISDASFVSIYRNTPDSTNPLYHSYVAHINGNQNIRVYLDGDYPKSMIDNMITLDGFDVYHEGFDKLQETSENTFKISQKNHIFSYNDADRKITCYEIQEEQEINQSRDDNNDLER